MVGAALVGDAVMTFDAAMARQAAETFGERLEMMVLGFIDKHRRRPLIVLANSRLTTEGWEAGFLDPNLAVEESAVHPELALLAQHGARAWRQWTPLEADEVVLTLRIVALNTCSITIVPRTEELARAIARVAMETVERSAGQN